MLVVALPAAIVGLMVRAAARRRVESLGCDQAARRRVADVRAGLVTVEGTWRSPRGAGDGLVEDASGAALLVTRDEGAEAIADGSPVLVVGCAGAEGEIRAGRAIAGMRGCRVVVACGVGHFVSTDPGLLEREERWARAARHRRGGAVRGGGGDGGDGRRWSPGARPTD